MLPMDVFTAEADLTCTVTNFGINGLAQENVTFLWYNRGTMQNQNRTPSHEQQWKYAQKEK